MLRQTAKLRLRTRLEADLQDRPRGPVRNRKRSTAAAREASAVLHNTIRTGIALGAALTAPLGLVACGAGDDRGRAVAAGGPATATTDTSGDSDTAASASAKDRSAPHRPRTEPPVVPLSVKPRLPADARTYDDRRDRLRVKLPADWHRASDRATDRVSLIADIVLAVGTSPIRPRPGAACSDAPDEPRVDIGPTDVLIVVEEDVRARADLARKRPRFRLLKQVASPGKPRRARTAVFPSWHCRNEVGVSGLHETSFADSGRVFSVTAIIGKAASGETRSETLAVLNSLKPLED